MNEQVKRNIQRFPEDFMFQVKSDEVPERLKSHFATLNENNKRGTYIKPDSSAIDKMLLGQDYTV